MQKQRSVRGRREATHAADKDHARDRRWVLRYNGKVEFVATPILGHHSQDVGGNVPGSIEAAPAHDLAEGIRIPVIKIVQSRQLDRCFVMT